MAHIDRDEDDEVTAARGSSRRWAKILAFSLGLAASLGTYAFARPHLAAWRSWAVTHLS